MGEKRCQYQGAHGDCGEPRDSEVHGERGNRPGSEWLHVFHDRPGHNPYRAPTDEDPQPTDPRY